MNLNKKMFAVLVALTLAVLACNVTVPTSVAVPTGLPALPTVNIQVNPAPQGGSTPAPAPVPVTGGANQTLIFYAFLALLAVIVLLGFLAMTRKSGESKDETKQ